MRTFTVFFMVVLAVSVCDAQWVQTAAGPDSMVMTLAVSPNAAGGTKLFAGTCNVGVFLSTNGGAGWTELDLLGECVIGLFVRGENLFVGTFLTGTVFRSTDSGTSWTELDTIWGTDCFIARGTDLFGGMYSSYPPRRRSSIVRSADNGTTWNPVNTGLLPETDIQTFALSHNGAGDTCLLAGGSVCNGPCTGCIYRSTNNGGNWTLVSYGATDGYVEASTFALIGTDVFASIGNGVLRSTDYGAQWTRAGSWPSGQDNTCLAASGTNLFAGTFQGDVFLSTNNGTSWTPVSTGLPPGIWISSLAIVGANVFAATITGVWRRPLSEMTTPVEPATSDLPCQVLFQQNFPNPFNPVTTFQFSIVNRQLTIMKVYDVLGREVATLMNEVKQPGTYTLQWDASRQASGVYFYRLQAGSFVETRKLILLK